MTWGRDTDEHEAARPAHGLRRRRRHPGRHRRRLRRRRGRAGPRRRCSATWSPRDDRSCSPPRPASPGRDGTRGVDTSRARTCSTRSTRSLRRLGTDHVDLWQVHAWTRGTPLEETLAALDAAVAQRAGPLRRDLQLHRLADRAGRHLAARVAGPGARSSSTQVEYSLLQRGVEREVVPAAQALGLGRAALVAARARRADRQVPQRHARRLPRRPRRTSRRSSSRTSTPDAPARRDGRRHRRRRARAGPARGRAGLGARPARVSSRRSSAPGPPPSCAASLQAEDARAARRDPRRPSTRCRGRRAAIPDSGRDQR